jgi:hypothetical protein
MLLFQIIKDTLKPKGTWEHKRLASFTSFWVSVIYAFCPLFTTFVVQEFVFWGFLTFSATSMGLTVLNKKIEI